MSFAVYEIIKLFELISPLKKIFASLFSDETMHRILSLERFGFLLIPLALLFLASTVFAYYPYGPEYRIYGTETYLRTGYYPVSYTNYYPETYTVYSGPYEAYTGYYYRPAYFASPSYVVTYPYYYSGSYVRPYYYRDYPEATSYAMYSNAPTSYVSSSYY